MKSVWWALGCERMDVQNGRVTLVGLAAWLARSVSQARIFFMAPLLAALVSCGGGQANESASTATAAGEAGRVSALNVVGTAAATNPTSSPPATLWTPCASEGQTCAFTGTKQVRYGVPSKWVVRTLTGGTPCTNAVFGDPAVGTGKSCAVADVDDAPVFRPANWTLCAAEGGTCVFSDTRQVRYGTPTQAVTQYFTGSVACSNAMFGDPALGTGKSCWYSTQASTLPSWIYCGLENQRCAFSGTRAVRYGTATDYVIASYTDGVDCTNAVFGDPAIGYGKACSYSSVVDSAAAKVPPALPSVTLPAVIAAALGTPLQLVAAVVDTKGVAVAGATVAWTIADPTIATLGAGGLATPLRPGYTTVTASALGQSATAVLTVRGPTPIPTRSQYVGTNLGGVAYWGSNFPFADLLKSSGGWSSQDSSGKWGAPFPSTSADGYPTALAAGQRALAPVAWNGSHYPAGQYTLLWDGQGTMSFPLSNVKVVSSTPNRIVVEPGDLNGAIWVGIEATNPANPVRNVRFLWPGTEATYAAQPFNPAYLAKIAPFSQVRFMDWGQTNGSPLVEWADRPLPSNVTYATPKGVPVEVMIDLANSLHVDPWFCIPHQASDDYVRQFAALVHARLDPTLRPHIEYSNEVWNSGFSQNAWANAQSVAKGLARPWSMPSIFYARRAVQIFKLVQQVYGSTDAARLVRVLAGQSEWTQFLHDAINDTDTAANVDAMAIAPYFNAKAADDPANLATTLGSGADAVVDQMLANIRGPIKSQMAATVALAAPFRLKVLAYESGPGDSTSYFPAASQDAMTALFAAANASPRMKSVYTEYYTQWKAAGGGMMNQYVDVGAWGKFGFWGALQNVTDDVSTSPKYQGLMAFIAANPVAAAQTTGSATTAATR